MADADMVFIDPESGFEIRPMPVARDSDVAAVLADAVGTGTPDDAQARLGVTRQGVTNKVLGGFINGELVAAYTLERSGMANEITLIAVREDHRRRGIGRALLQDALRRSGRRPLVVETDDDTLAFYKTCGFKMVGRRKHPSGTWRYRLGWHAPGAGFKGGTSGALAHLGISDENC